MSVITIKALLEAGVHFGHQTKRWNPKMAPYIYTERAGIHIIDLQKTSDCIDVAYAQLREIGANGGKVLFIGTKKQSQEVVREEAIRCGHFFVDVRWLGGTLTNFKTIKRSIKKLQDLKKEESDGTFEALPKKEVIEKRKEMAKLEKFLNGFKEMKELPQAIFIIDPRKERNAILEAKKLGIPVFGIVDTNCDPDDVDFVIPSNDDALRAVKLIVSKMADALIEGAGGEVPVTEEESDGNESMDVVVEEVRVSEKYDDVKEEKPVRRAKAQKEETKVEEAQEKEEPKAEEPQVDLESLKVDQLRELAKARGISGYSKMKKAELIEALK